MRLRPCGGRLSRRPEPALTTSFLMPTMSSRFHPGTGTPRKSAAKTPGGLIFLNPLLGMALGATAGAVSGALRDVDQRQIHEGTR